MDVFDALADPTRRRLLARLARGPHTVTELATTEPVSRPAVSKHLRVLLESGAVTATAEGRHRRYRLRPDALAAVRDYLAVLDGTIHPPIPEHALGALDLEVRRTVRERSADGDAASIDRKDIA